MGVFKRFTKTKFTGRPGYMNENFQAENGQKLTNLNQYILIITNIKKNGLWVLSTLSTTFFLDMFVYLNLNTIFFCFVSFFLVFFFFFFPCYPLLNR